MARDSGVYVALDPATPGWPRHRTGTAGRSIGDGFDRAFQPLSELLDSRARRVNTSASGGARTVVYGSFNLKLHYTCTGQKAQRAWIRASLASSPWRRAPLRMQRHPARHSRRRSRRGEGRRRESRAWRPSGTGPTGQVPDPRLRGGDTSRAGRRRRRTKTSRPREIVVRASQCPACAWSSPASRPMTGCQNAPSPTQLSVPLHPAAARRPHSPPPQPQRPAPLRLGSCFPPASRPRPQRQRP